MKQFACLYNGAYAYVQVGEGGVVETVPTIGQKWDGETISFK